MEAFFTRYGRTSFYFIIELDPYMRSSGYAYSPLRASCSGGLPWLLVIVLDGYYSLIDECKYYETIAYSAYFERKKKFQFFFRKRVIS